MQDGASDISKYMEVILTSDFPQAHLLDAERFSDFLTAREIRISVEDLEYFDEKGIIRPALRLNRPVASEGPLKYAVLQTDIFSIQHMYNEGWIEFPKDSDFVPWKNYEDGYEEKTSLYYHPFQFVPVRSLTMVNEFKLTSAYFEKVTDVQKSFETMKKNAENRIEICQKSAIETWIPMVGILMLLEEAYYPLLGCVSMNINENSFEKWKNWRINIFSPKRILSKYDLTVEQIKEVYYAVASEGQMVDPNANWYSLLRLIKRSRKERLKGKALLAQGYYDLAQMVAHLIYDVTKEKMTDPDDLFDGTEGSWKPDHYGNPFGYNNPETRLQIRNAYFINKPSFIAIVFEGTTEQVVIEKIFGLFMKDHEEKGISSIMPKDLEIWGQGIWMD